MKMHITSPATIRRAACAFLFATLFSGCSQYATVTERRPLYHPLHTAVGALARVDAGIQKALGEHRHDTVQCLGCLLDSAREASDELKQNPGNADARAAYNFALARIFTTLKDGKLDPWTKPLHVTAASGEYVLTHAPFSRKVQDPALYDFTPADQFDIGGTYVQERSTKEGVGAPLVAIGKKEREDAKAQFAGSRVFYGVTAVANFEPAREGVRRVVFSFNDPLAKESVSLGNRTVPLAADFTVPIAVMLARENPKKLELARLLQPEKYAETARIVRLQPYDPNKVVVIVVHGLNDSPATWTPMINSLRGDPFIRAHYQFWFFSHPSGYPYPYSAGIMRQELDQIEKKFPLHKPIVLIGHSMGGLISRLMITDPDDRLWRASFGKSPAETPLAPKARELLEQALLFQHRKEVGRVIFISAPHRGSDLATAWYGRFGASLVRAPKSLVQFGADVRKVMTLDSTALKLNRVPNSVDTLAPNNRFVLAINTIPITAGIPYHSIIGDRGKGGNKDHTPPVSSDGIVPYWSSHLDGAQSELIVPSHHSAHQNPQAIAEVRRILHLNAGDHAK